MKIRVVIADTGTWIHEGYGPALRTREVIVDCDLVIPDKWDVLSLTLVDDKVIWDEDGGV